MTRLEEQKLRQDLENALDALRKIKHTLEHDTHCDVYYNIGKVIAIAGIALNEPLDTDID